MLWLKGKQSTFQIQISKTEFYNTFVYSRKTTIYGRNETVQYREISSVLISCKRTSQNTKHGSGKAKKAEVLLLQSWTISLLSIFISKEVLAPKAIGSQHCWQS